MHSSLIAHLAVVVKIKPRTEVNEILSSIVDGTRLDDHNM